MAEGGGGSVPDHDLRRRFEGQLSKFTNVVKGWQFRYTVSVLDSVADPGCLSRIPDPPDPQVFGPPGSGSINQRCGSGYGSFYHQAKKVRKTFISPAL
jgi:hypothetical protein